MRILPAVGGMRIFTSFLYTDSLDLSLHSMEPLKHECGVAMIRLRKPLAYYQEKYGTWMYGLNKLYLLMEKQLGSLSSSSTRLLVTNISSASAPKVPPPSKRSSTPSTPPSLTSPQRSSPMQPMPSATYPSLAPASWGTCAIARRARVA